MDLGTAGLSEQPFPTHGKPLASLSYASNEAALDVLKDTCKHRTGLSLLQGPALSGKSTLIRQFIDSMPKDCCAAVIDAKGLDTTELLISVMRQFGYRLELDSAKELLGLVRVFALQQADSHESPLLIIENTHELTPDAMHALCELAELRVRTSSALKFVLVSDRPLQSTISAQGMEAMAMRLLHDFHLRPMNQDETKYFLHTKLKAAGSEQPADVIPDEVCQELWRASAGWPGIVDRVALLALANATALPVTVENIEHPSLPLGTWAAGGQGKAAPDEIFPPDPPRLIVTNNGSVMHDLTMDKSRILVGRSEHNDISINSRFVSRHHAMLVRHKTVTVLMDLNSTNGSFVNSRRVSNRVLIHEDIIKLGHHTIKFYDPSAAKREQSDGADIADTAVMKTLQDMRKQLAKENTELLPTASENLPTIQN